MKDKNIHPLLGKPLIEYSIEQCLKSEYVSEVYVSTESEDISKVSRAAGAKLIMRPAELADDKTPKIIAIRQAIEQLEMEGEQFDDVAIVQ